MTPVQEAEAQTCLSECNDLIAHGSNEASLRSNFTSRLRTIAGTPHPWWVREHITKTEAALKSAARSRLGGRVVTNFVDNLVGLTAIEYEKDLTNPTLFQDGLQQVHDYLANLLNTGVPTASVRGVLSDTVRWHAYKVTALSPSATTGGLVGSDLTLAPIDTADCHAADLAAARQLLQFLERHLGRDGGQVLAAQQLSEMFGVATAQGVAFVAQALAVVDAAVVANPAYAAMVQGLWANFVSFVGNAQTAGQFDKDAYACELYLSTLSKLIAANVVQGSALISASADLLAILDGRHFQALGLTNFIEFDYFGWLIQPAHRAPLLTLAGDIQQALRAFDFSYLRAEDLFGPLVSQLAQRTQRVLLGQEPTPAWLVRQVADAVEARLPQDQPRRCLDPCCGSGAFVVELLARKVRQPGFVGLPRDARVRDLCGTVCGFDIDPLAVMFAKVSWLIASRPALTPFNGAFAISIPIYHADSLFAIAPLARTVLPTAAGDFDLSLDGQVVTMPGFLARPSRQAFFDEFVDGLYRLAQLYASGLARPVNPADVGACVVAAQSVTNSTLSTGEVDEAVAFGASFAERLADLERQGRNGLWLHMLKNGYRPALVRGQFNAVLTNFPWLTVSKLANNPYRDALKRRIAAYNLKPPRQSAHHIELATVFVMHAVDHYLEDGGVLGAVLPNSIFQGTQHEALRTGRYRNPPSNLAFDVLEVWDVDRKAFRTNVAAVIVGKKGNYGAPPTGASVSEARRVAQPLFLSMIGPRTAWTSQNANLAAHSHYAFKEGVDLFPRTVWFHEITFGSGPGGAAVAHVAPIANASSASYYLVAQPKKCKSFRASHCTVAKRWIFPVLISNHLVPFHLSEPALSVLPLAARTATDRHLGAASSVDVAVDRSASNHFARVYMALQSVWSERPIDEGVVFDRIRTSWDKLSPQAFASGQCLVLFGAGGTTPCAAKLVISPSMADTLILDQTLYWSEADSVDEADFLVGLANSRALAAALQPFQPKGKEGERHLHSLVAQALPRWDAANPAHQASLVATRQVETDLLAAAASSTALRSALTVPTANVNVRRSAVKRAFTALPSAIAYEAACAAVL